MTHHLWSPSAPDGFALPAGGGAYSVAVPSTPVIRELAVLSLDPPIDFLWWAYEGGRFAGC